MTDIALINRTARIRDAVFAGRLAAFQAQITEDFAPLWGVAPATLHFVGKAEAPDPAHWRVWLLDNSDQAGDLGYHEDAAGVPEAKIFCEEDMRYGSEISVTISHELLEMLADPLTSRMGPLIDGAQYIVEVCDPVEADDDGYEKAGVKLSNFALPAYYQPGQPGVTQAAGGPWDFRGLLTGPCPMLRPGGYAMFLKNGGWTSTMARYEDGALSHRAIRPYGRSWQRAAVPPRTRAAMM
jgi:hypothetical protein